MINKTTPQECFPTILSTTPVTEWATPHVNASVVRQLIHNDTTRTSGTTRAYRVVAALIVLEHIMIIIGAIGGTRLGWTMGLQGLYFIGLVFLSGLELASVVSLIPNGRLWCILNRNKLPLALLNGLLYKWDLYGDVGFALLVYHNRASIFESFWYIPVLLTSMVILLRLGVCLYYLGKIGDLRETAWSRLFVPSFLSIFGLLVENLQISDLEGTLIGAHTYILFQISRLCFEDAPELIFQSLFLFEPSSSVTCVDCPFGFVFISLLSSIFSLLLTLYNTRTYYGNYKQTKARLDSHKKHRGNG
jgi:hypothetical protein